MTNQTLIPYTLEKVEEGWVSRGSHPNEKATSFGTTKEDAGNNLLQAMQEYLQVYPEKIDEMTDVHMKEIIN